MIVSMAFVIKIECEGALRRRHFNLEEPESLSFAKLEGRIRDLFKLLSTAQLKITYKDKEDDDVTMTNDQELKDAYVIQKLNPLRLKVVVLPPRTGESDGTTDEAAPAEITSAQEPELSDKPTIPEAYVNQSIVESNPPVPEGVCPPSRIPEVMVDSVSQSVQTTDGVNPSTQTSQLTPLGWLRNLPSSLVSNELEKHDKTHVESPAETSPVNSSAKSTKEVVHKGVTCDMCDISPIAGIRYKAIKKMNYDLCGRCFDRSTRADEYCRIEEPLSRPTWGTISVKMVPMSPATGVGPNDLCSENLVKLVLAPRDGRCKPMKSC